MAKDKTIDTECTHHWQLASPSGELTNGTCKKCGIEKQFTGESRIAGRPPGPKAKRT
tara:strand:- start:437 stop:607 length:171 start_codon:yes stop_codon:yes gene_type:complete